MRPGRTSVRVAELSVGNVLSPTGARIVAGPSAGISTPSGCLDVLVKYPKQADHEPPIRRTWRRDTRVTIHTKELT